MQSDCNLVLYKNGNKVLWASNTYRRGTGCYFTMQTDGNAVVYTSARKPVFATGTNGRNDGAHYIIMQGDGNLVMYNGSGRAIWATFTNGLAFTNSQDDDGQLQQILDGRESLRHALPGGVLATPAELGQP
ncbi:hypothetical protein L7F22_003491 [Adiantum nelumboides]|nr:hypothetical protein [Adiantum nelumboides]